LQFSVSVRRLPFVLTLPGRFANFPEFKLGGGCPLINKELLEILACPVCKTEVTEEEDRLVCTECGRRYPVRDGIPIMLVDEAEQPREKQQD
jgi:uncharacterized protein YbaR (Trm112 family)